MACHLESLTDSLSGKTQQKEKAMFSFTSLTASLAQGNGPSISSILILVLGLLVAVVVLLLLPPLLYSSAWQTSWRDFHANLRPISLLALGMVLLTTIVVAVVAHVLIPGLPWAVAFVLGAIVSPTDAVAATAIAQRLGIPQRIVTILEGESLVNDATGLVAYRFAVAAVVTGVFSPFEASLQFVVVSVGGIALGLVAGWSLSYVHRWLDNPPLEITVTLVTPFAVYLLGEEVLHVSGVLATVTTGLYLT